MAQGSNHQVFPEMRAAEGFGEALSVSSPARSPSIGAGGVLSPSESQHQRAAMYRLAAAQGRKEAQLRIRSIVAAAAAAAETARVEAESKAATAKTAKGAALAAADAIVCATAANALLAKAAAAKTAIAKAATEKSATLLITATTSALTAASAAASYSMKVSLEASVELAVARAKHHIALASKAAVRAVDTASEASAAAERQAEEAQCAVEYAARLLVVLDAAAAARALSAATTAAEKRASLLTSAKANAAAAAAAAARHAMKVALEAAVELEVARAKQHTALALASEAVVRAASTASRAAAAAQRQAEEAQCVVEVAGRIGAVLATASAARALSSATAAAVASAGVAQDATRAADAAEHIQAAVVCAVSAAKAAAMFAQRGAQDATSTIVAAADELAGRIVAAAAAREAAAAEAVRVVAQAVVAEKEAPHVATGAARAARMAENAAEAAARALAVDTAAFEIMEAAEIDVLALSQATAMVDARGVELEAKACDAHQEVTVAPRGVLSPDCAVAHGDVRAETEIAHTTDAGRTLRLLMRTAPAFPAPPREAVQARIGQRVGRGSTANPLALLQKQLQNTSSSPDQAVAHKLALTESIAKLALPSGVTEREDGAAEVEDKGEEEVAEEEVWNEYTDSTSGSSYYTHDVTGETRWSYPSGWNVRVVTQSERSLLLQQKKHADTLTELIAVQQRLSAMEENTASMLAAGAAKHSLQLDARVQELEATHEGKIAETMAQLGAVRNEVCEVERTHARQLKNASAAHASTLDALSTELIRERERLEAGKEADAAIISEMENKHVVNDEIHAEEIAVLRVENVRRAAVLEDTNEALRVAQAAKLEASSEAFVRALAAAASELQTLADTNEALRVAQVVKLEASSEAFVLLEATTTAVSTARQAAHASALAATASELETFRVSQTVALRSHRTVAEETLRALQLEFQAQAEEALSASEAAHSDAASQLSVCATVHKTALASQVESAAAVRAALEEQLRLTMDERSEKHEVLVIAEEAHAATLAELAAVHAEYANKLAAASDQNLTLHEMCEVYRHSKEIANVKLVSFEARTAADAEKMSATHDSALVLLGHGSIDAGRAQLRTFESKLDLRHLGAHPSPIVSADRDPASHDNKTDDKTEKEDAPPLPPRSSPPRSSPLPLLPPQNFTTPLRETREQRSGGDLAYAESSLLNSTEYIKKDAVALHLLRATPRGASHGEWSCQYHLGAMRSLHTRGLGLVQFPRLTARALAQHGYTSAALVKAVAAVVGSVPVMRRILRFAMPYATPSEYDLKREFITSDPPTTPGPGPAPSLSRAHARSTFLSRHLCNRSGRE